MNHLRPLGDSGSDNGTQPLAFSFIIDVIGRTEGQQENYYQIAAMYIMVSVSLNVFRYFRIYECIFALDLLSKKMARVRISPSL